MRIHSRQHEPFEGLGNIEVWAKNKGHSISRTLLFKNEKLSENSNFDWLVIMGGSMNIYEEDKFPWLREEKNFIAKAIAANKILLGVCLGSQLIADVLGGKVSKNKFKEIGWFPVSLTREARNPSIFSSLPCTFTAFHWHGDTFKIPQGAKRIAQSEGCANQAFECGRAIGLQFHLEYISKIANVHEMNKTLNLILDNMEREFEEPLKNIKLWKTPFSLHY
jgi:GMP synthase-like glutamine amidotransferase